jgi:anti-sigma regulatory factor (Ser/Thr protein kinase)
VADEHSDKQIVALIAAPADPWTEEMSAELSGLEYDVAVGSSFEEIISISHRKAGEFAFVMVAPSVDDATYARLAHTIKLSAGSGMLPILLGRADLSTLSKPTTPQIMPDATFSSVGSAVELIKAEADRWRDEARHGRHVVFRGSSDPDSVQRLRNMLEAFYHGAFTDKREAYRILASFREAIDNAARHGNAESPEKFLTVTLSQDEERISLDVKDEGPGFDSTEFLEAARTKDAMEKVREHISLGKAGGLGIRLMMDCLDEVSFGDEGRRLTLVKLRTPDVDDNDESDEDTEDEE